MPVIDVTAAPAPIVFGATGLVRIQQRLRLLLSTPAYSVPLDRDFAINADIDAPINVAQARMTGRIAAAIRKYEPAAQLVSVTYRADALNGVLQPVVRVEVKEADLT
jgi:uncharacterized protein